MQMAAAWGLNLADGVEPVHLAVYDQYMARAGGYNDASFSVTIPHFGDDPPETALQKIQPNLKLLGLLNVQYLASAFPMKWAGLGLEIVVGDTYIYTNPQALPRAWVAHQTLPIAKNWIAQLEALPNLGDVVVIERGPQLNNPTLPKSPAQISHYSTDLIRVETDIAAPGWLVLSEIWYPGWQATVNGRPQPVEMVNGLLRGLYLDQPGHYQITLTYRPTGVTWGVWVAGITAGLLLLMGLIWGISYFFPSTYKYFCTGRVVREGSNCCSSSTRRHPLNIASNSGLSKSW
jgi:hypothetical protein